MVYLYSQVFCLHLSDVKPQENVNDGMYQLRIMMSLCIRTKMFSSVICQF